LGHPSEEGNLKELGIIPLLRGDRAAGGVSNIE